MKCTWKNTLAALLFGGFMASPALGQPIGGTQPPTKNTPDKNAGQSKIEPPVTSSTDSARPGEPEKDPLVDAATKLFQEQKEEEAYKKLVEAASKNDKLPPARLMLHRMYMSAGRAVDARRAIELASVENPDHPDIYITFGMQALQQARLTDAMLQFERALRTMDDTKRWNDTQRKSVTLACLSGLANTAEARQQYDVARKHYEAILKLDFPKKQLAGFRASLGRALFMMDKREDALKEMQAAYADEPDMDPAGVLMAKLYTGKTMQERDPVKQKELIAKTKEWYEYALKTDPKNYKAHIGYAVWLFDFCYQDKSFMALSEEELKEAAKLDPKKYDNKVLRGLQLRWQGNFEAAEQEFEASLKEKSDDFYTINQLILALVEQKGNPAKMQRAMQLATQSIRAFGNRIPEASATYGWVMFKNNRPEDAEKALLTSLQSGQYTPDGLYYYAQLLRNQGKLTEAGQALKGACDQPGRFMYRKEAMVDLGQLTGGKPAGSP